MSYELEQSLFLRFLISPRWRVLRHVSFSTIFISLILLSKDPEESEYIGNAEMYLDWISFAWLFALVYLNAYVLVPKILFKGKLITYFSVVTLLTVVNFGIMTIADGYLENYRITPSKVPANLWQPFVGFLIVFFIIIAASTAIKLFQQWLRDSTKMAEMEQLSLRHELSQLKSQVNPHFLFNTLNNLQVLIEYEPGKAKSVVSNLTRLLRYQLYDGARQSVPLLSDLNFLEDFLSLEKIRRDNFSYEMISTGSCNMVFVPHFIFIAFVENAIKHSYDPHHPSYVSIKCSVENQTLKFTCKNSLPHVAYKQEPGGIGLINITRRLELLYSGKHQLEQQATKSEYIVNLEIPL